MGEIKSIDFYLSSGVEERVHSTQEYNIMAMLAYKRLIAMFN